jgi:DNA-directed RNA polymerase subunit RPC12/RpoP
VTELDTFLSSVKLQSRCGGCGALLAFIADRNEVDCPRCKTRLRVEGLFLLRK